MADETRDPHLLAPGQAPTPFTADEIRDNSQVGKSVRSRIEAAGAAPYFRINHYVECDENGATLERSELSLDGSPLGEPELVHVTWLDLQGHASFPAADTTIERESIETPLGRLDCLRYTVRDGADEDVFWFAQDHPGMPIRYLTRSGGDVRMTASVVDIQL